jgi:hypothetical protein
MPNMLTPNMPNKLGRFDPKHPLMGVTAGAAHRSDGVFSVGPKKI